MPRRAREKSPTGIYHVMMRGINRQSIFEDNEDRQKIIEIFSRYQETNCYRLFAYCLMDNHIHILLQEIKEPIAQSIKRISSSYVLWFNKKYGRCGHLFQERFKSEVVENDSYFLTVLRYIHNNPVKAKIVADLYDYKWSSYGQYMGRGNIIDKEYVLRMFKNIPGEAIELFNKYSRELNADSCLELEENKVVISDDRLREAIKLLFGIEAIRIGNEPKERQDLIFKKLKHLNGVSIRQIARITGVSQTRIWKA